VVWAIMTLSSVAIGVAALLTALLVYAAWIDLKTRKVPFIVMWSVYGWGVIDAWQAREWAVFGMALAAGLLSSIGMKRIWRLWFALLAGIPVYFFRYATDTAAAMGLIWCAWLAFEFGLVGGADSTILIGLTAMFPTRAFVVLAVAVILAGHLFLIFRRHGRKLFGVLGAHAAALLVRTPLPGSMEPAIWMLAIAGAVQAWLNAV